jgi:coproporphyrinogen III oxidase
LPWVFFFDDLNDRSPEGIFEFCKDAVNHVVPAYDPIFGKHKNDQFTEEQKEWQQLLRRGRYAEFNLVDDRGSIFCLKTIGRIESILMSSPETASWLYDRHPDKTNPARLERNSSSSLKIRESGSSREQLKVEMSLHA